MRDQHLSHQDFRHLIEHERGEVENRLLLHHLAVCSTCYAAAGHILDLHEAGVLPTLFSSVDLDLEQSRVEAPGLFRELNDLAPDHQVKAIEELMRFRSWGLAELLADRSLAACSRAPQEAVRMSELAVLIASLLDEWEPAELGWLCQLRARSWAHLGNARRVGGDLRGADEAFETSLSWWSEGASMGDVLEYEAQILALTASLRRTQGQFSEALSLLQNALDAGARGTLRSAILVNRAFAFGEGGDLDGALGALQEALEVVQPETAPRLYFALHHNILDALSKAGRYAEAESLLLNALKFATASSEPLDRVRVLWIQARVAVGLGDIESGLALFEGVRRKFLKEGLILDAALASLELAAHLVTQGELDKVERISRDLVPIFAAQGASRECVAAVSVFCRAVEEKVLSFEVIGWARELLEKASGPTLAEAAVGDEV